MQKAKPITYLIIVILALGVLIFFESKNQRYLVNQNLVKNQIECKKAAEEYAKIDPQSLAVGNQLDEEQYVFSQKLNTCLYREEWSMYGSDGSLGTHDYYIKDIYSNKVLVNLFQHFDSAGNINESNHQEDVYENMAKEYFGDKK